MRTLLAAGVALVVGGVVASLLMPDAPRAALLLAVAIAACIVVIVSVAIDRFR